MPRALEIRSSLVITSEFRRFALRPFFYPPLTLWETCSRLPISSRKKIHFSNDTTKDIRYIIGFIVGLFTLGSP